jgi:hypothetical protein
VALWVKITVLGYVAYFVRVLFEAQKKQADSAGRSSWHN